MIDVLVAGEIYVDLLLSGFDAFPEPGREVFASRFSREIGGGTSITACRTRKARGVDAECIGLVGEDIGRLGKGPLASGRRRCLRRCRLTRRNRPPSPWSRQPRMIGAFLSYQGANFALEESLLEAVRSSDWVPPRHVHLAYAPLPANAIELCAAIAPKRVHDLARRRLARGLAKPS